MKVRGRDLGAADVSPLSLVTLRIWNKVMTRLAMADITGGVARYAAVRAEICRSSTAAAKHAQTRRRRQQVVHLVVHRATRTPVGCQHLLLPAHRRPA